MDVRRFHPARGGHAKAAPHEVDSGSEPWRCNAGLHSQWRTQQAYDATWCVLDVDEHPFVAEAFEHARAHEIRVAPSNPCIELWFLHHFADQRAHLDRHAAQRKADAHLGAGTGLDDSAFGQLADRHDVARERARRLEAMHEGNGTPFPGNCHSSVWSLVDSLARR